MANKKPLARKAAKPKPSTYKPLGLAVALGAASGFVVLILALGIRMESHDRTASTHTVRQVAGLTSTPAQEFKARELMSGQLIPGKKGIIVSITVVNQTDRPQSFIPIHQMFLHDELGHNYTMTPLGEVQHPIHAGKLQPNETRSGQVSFMVDNNSTGLNLLFDSRWNNGQPVSVSVQ